MAKKMQQENVFQLDAFSILTLREAVLLPNSQHLAQSRKSRSILKIRIVFKLFKLDKKVSVEQCLALSIAATSFFFLLFI